MGSTTSDDTDEPNQARERSYDGLNIPIEVVAQEIFAYLSANGYANPSQKVEDDRIVLTGGDLKVLLTGTLEHFTVSAGPRNNFNTKGDGNPFGLSGSPLLWLAKGAVVLWYKRNVDALFQSLDQKLYARAAISASGSPPLPSSTILEQIRQLAALRDQGVLTDEEFQAKKAELLKRI